MIRPDAWVPLAEIARAHGVRGEVRLRLFNKDSDVLLEQDEVLVRLTDGEEHEVSVDGARRADQAILIKLHSVDDRERADELRGALVCVRREAFPPLDDGEFYTCDALGAEVVLVQGATDATDAATEAGAQRLGHVRDLMSYPSVDVLVVRAEDGGPDWEIPLVAAYVARADVSAGRFVLRSIEGIERLAPRAKASAPPDDGP
ncbi:MAG: 16S rRNA processing protein RimM [Myxococcales bacterium]|jgi:16S rRNA processing protein RimM|nr:16S rRNA processing protein RimM [Myxococcales bacterium]MBL0193699.1 16S rRNA processing protein RimM [Myxococcales bacterium]HQY61025.1 ribosome maturation factor RimM [Polyangiaceae bacterium]